MQKVERKHEDAYLTGIVLLFKAESKLGPVHSARVSNLTFPETKRGSCDLYLWRSINRRTPLRVSPDFFEPYQRTPCFLANIFDGTQFVDSEQDIGSISMMFLRKSFEQSYLGA